MVLTATDSLASEADAFVSIVSQTEADAPICRRANFSEVREMMAPERVASLTIPLVMEDSGGDSVTVRRALPWEWLNANTTTLHLERPRRPNIPHFQLKF